MPFFRRNPRTPHHSRQTPNRNKWSPLPQHHIHVHQCHSTLTGTTSYWSQHGCSFCSANTTSHTPQFTVRYPPRTAPRGIITH